MEYRVGDLLCVPANGVGAVAAIGTIMVEGEPSEMYEIYVQECDVRVWVPVDRLVEMGVRPPMSLESVERTWEVIGSQEAPEKRGNWNRRRRRYNEQLASNEPEEMAQMLGELAAVRRDKVLSFGERRLFEKVRDMLIHEIAVARGAPVQVVQDRMTAVLAAE